MNEMSIEEACFLLKMMGPDLAIKLSRMVRMADEQLKVEVLGMSEDEKDCLFELELMTTALRKDRDTQIPIINFERLRFLALIASDVTYRIALVRPAKFEEILNTLPPDSRD